MPNRIKTISLTDDDKSYLNKLLTQSTLEIRVYAKNVSPMYHYNQNKKQNDQHSYESQNCHGLRLLRKYIYFVSVITKLSLYVSQLLFPCIQKGNYRQFSRTSFSLFISSGFAICPFMPVFLANCTSSAKALAVMATIGSFPFSP